MFINKLFSRFHGGGIVGVIAQKLGGLDKATTIDSDDIGAIFRHYGCSLGSGATK
jgi:hypothetical protein